MEQSNKKKIAVAIFIVLGFVLFLVAIFVIGSKENMFTATFQLKSEFITVSGLKTGGAVRFNGISVGKVDAIDILSTDRVLVTMTLEKSVQGFIKKDSKATVSSEGLVGNKVVEISPGSYGSPPVGNDEMIASVKPIEVQDIMIDLKASTENATVITQDLQEITTKINQGQGTLGKLVNQDTLYRSVEGTFKNFETSSGQLNLIFEKVGKSSDVISQDIIRLSGEVNNIADDIAEIVNKINSSESVIGTLFTDTAFANNIKKVMANTNAASKNLENGSYSFAQNMEALKHNFFFKGYFEDIGYWDKEKSDMTMNEKKRELQEIEQKIRMKKKELEELNNN